MFARPQKCSKYDHKIPISRENPHLNVGSGKWDVSMKHLISHFLRHNSICIKIPCGKWEVGCEHETSDFPFLTSHISFPASHIFIQSSLYLWFLYDAHDHIISYELFMFDFQLSFSGYVTPLNDYVSHLSTSNMKWETRSWK